MRRRCLVGRPAVALAKAGCWLLVVGGAAGAVIVPAAPLAAQRPIFTSALPASEFAARRAGVMRAIGDGVAVIQGATERAAYQQFHQSAQFFYLTGVEVPRAILVVDGRSRASTLFLNHLD